MTAMMTTVAKRRHHRRHSHIRIDMPNSQHYDGMTQVTAFKLHPEKDA